MNENVNVNKEYKDSVFSLLFSNPDLLRELYSAIEGVELPPDIPRRIRKPKGLLTLSDTEASSRAGTTLNFRVNAP